jgi:uncharacterized protein (DUF302 family)
MTTKQISVQRVSIASSKPFEDVVAKFEAAIGHPDMKTLFGDIGSAKTYAEMEEVIHKATGPSGLMEFIRFDLGAILRKETGGNTPKSLRFLVGNPLIMKQMAVHVADAGSYAPVTILIDERPDGVHLSYDRMASFLATYGSAEALKVAQDLDSKVDVLLTAAAA